MPKLDIESGGGVGVTAGNELYPGMIESPELRWAFIRKVYAILTLQMILTVAVAATVVFVRPIPDFITKTPAGLCVYIVSFVLSLIIFCVLFAYHKKHPINLILLALFTFTIACNVGLSCSYTKGRIVLEAAILTAVMVTGLTIYTFWAVKRGQDFGFLGPFLFGSFLVLIFFGIMQIFFPLGKLSMMIFSGLFALLFCGYIVYDTNELIKRFNYDEYICAALCLYLDIINLFLWILSLLNEADS